MTAKTKHPESTLETKIGDIPTFVVNSHERVLPKWFDMKEKPAIVVHIGARHGLYNDNPLIKDLPFTNPEESTYASIGINSSNFICFAVHHKIVGMMYRFDPRKAMVKAYYGAIIPAGCKVHELDVFKTERAKGNITWGRYHLYNPPTFNLITKPIVYKELSKLKQPLILDIDLDGFFSNDAFPDKQLKGKINAQEEIERTYHQNIAKTFDFLKDLPRKPDLITIAQSATVKDEYTPRKYASKIQAVVLDSLGFVYA